jgi:hypothetical protein
MDKGILSDREKAMEANYFRQQDARLLERLRHANQFDAMAEALRDGLQVDNPELLERVRAQGIDADTAAAFLLLPLVEVAWAEGSVSRKEQATVVRIAHERGVDKGSAAEARLLEWLHERPSDALFDVAAEVLNYGLAVFPPAEREERVQRIVDACHEVAAASGSEIARQLGLGDGVSKREARILDKISTTLHRHEGAKPTGG